MNNETVTLDVCDDIRHGREPFSRIMKTVREIALGQNLLLIAPFKPVPLFAVLNKLGFVHEARQIQNGDWEVLFTRASGKGPGRGDLPIGQDARIEEIPQAGKINPGEILAARERHPAVQETQFIDIDARGLEPPQPMVKILEALAMLPRGTGIRACTDRRPMHLYAQLEARGFTGESEEQNDGSFITHIRRN